MTEELPDGEFTHPPEPDALAAQREVIEDAIAQQAAKIRAEVLATDSDNDLLFAGGPMDPFAILAGYQAGCFPMGINSGGTPPVGWWSPDPRGIVGNCQAHVSRSTRRLFNRFAVTVDHAFSQVIAACADPTRDGSWITDQVVATYEYLHRWGAAHSVEVWDAHGQLAGGLYGIAQGGLFAGESMFHHVTGASKIAVAAAAAVVKTAGDHAIFDVQWQTDHLATLGVIEIPRTDYVAAVHTATTGPAAPWQHLSAAGPHHLTWHDGATTWVPGLTEQCAAPKTPHAPTDP